MSNTPYKKNTVENSTIQTVGNVHIGDITYTINDKEVKIPTLLTNNIPSNADHILGRIDELTAISKHLAQNKPTVLVNGIGGIGKTSVATKYVAAYGHQYKHIAWLTVQSSVAEAFTNDVALLKALHIEHDVRQLIQTQRLTDAFKLVVHKLNTLDKTLVVLDNANNPDDLITHKNLFDTAKCHYLITSRTQPQEWTIVAIDHLPEDEAVSLFRKLAPSVLATDKDLKSLLSKLFYHTLLIELVAKAVENAGFSFAELQTMIETKFIHDAQLNEDIVSTGKHGDSAADNAKRAKIEEYIWLIFSNVEDLSDDAKQILRGMALLPVATPFDRNFLKGHLALFDVKDIVPNLSLLVELGWLEKEENKSFKMHPLIADVVTKHLEVDVTFANEYIKDTADLLKYDNNLPNDNLYEIIQREPYGERLVELFFNCDTLRVSYLLHRLNWVNYQFGFFQKAALLGERALEIVEKLPLASDDTLTQCLNTLSNTYKQLGRYNESAILLETSLELEIKNNGLYNPNTAIHQSNLGVTYRYLGRFDEAIVLLESALATDIKNFGIKHPATARHQSNLALVYQELKQYDKAADLLEKSLYFAEKFYNKEHPEISMRQSSLSIVYIELERFPEALDLAQRASFSDMSNLGLKHPSVARSYSNLATVYVAMNQTKKAVVLLEKALNIDIENFGLNHIKVGFRLRDLAVVYYMNNQKTKSKASFQKAYQIFLDNYGEEHLDTIKLKEYSES
jgi:tetratricopeptide (TPR) repeat protein